MGAQRATLSSARERYYKRRLKRMSFLLTIALVMAALVCGSLAYPVMAPSSGSEISSRITPTPEHEMIAGDTGIITPTIRSNEGISQQIIKPLPTQGQIVPPSEDTHLLYYTIAGDSLPVIGHRFGVNLDQITSPDPIERRGLIPPGQLLNIPNTLEETSSTLKLLPDSEVTFSPSTVDFDINAYVNAADGYLSTYSQWLQSTGVTSGADVIARIALEYSVNPRLILAFLEYQSGWVYGDPENQTAELYPMGYVNSGSEGLYRQSAWFASHVMEGYYGWREGRRLVINFQDRQVLRLAPQLNAGTVGLMNAFTYLYDFEEWAARLYGEESFFARHETMFGNPWIRAQAVEPLIPVDTVQPEMVLPFELGKTWVFTGGPHPAWSAVDVWAALDFAPPSSGIGCIPSSEWVVASMPGLVVRSESGVVVIDLDGDGHEQTGWTLLYLHIETKNRIEKGSWVEVGDRIGHPSCEGGRSTGTHVHIARRYNGEWVPADGPLPFVISGWTARAGVKPYQGWLTRETEIIYANTTGPSSTHITREE
jgi:LasA protease